MTINIALATSDALVIGCDSIASTTAYYLDPMSILWERDDDGNTIQDEIGRFTLKFRADDFESVVTNAWGGVTKMFEIHPQPAPVVAATAGLAKLNGRTVSSIAREFFDSASPDDTKRMTDVSDICNKFLVFMRAEYDRHYKDAGFPEIMRDGPEFVVGGYGKGDSFPSIFKINVQDNSVRKAFNPGETGLSWNGQSDAVERFIRGYDSDARNDLRDSFSEVLKSYSIEITTHFANKINEILDKLGAVMPDGIDMSVPEPALATIDWKKYRLQLDYANMPIQDAINFVSFLVMVQAGKSRFAFGVPTVGGRTHIGIVTKAKGFELLNEPKLQHRHTGFSDDPQ